MAKYKVLLVDDEESFVEPLAERMEARGFSVAVAHNGQEALQIAGERSFDAIFLDLAMPGIDGIETLKRLKEKNPDLQVVLLTVRWIVGLV